MNLVLNILYLVCGQDHFDLDLNVSLNLLLVALRRRGNQDLNTLLMTAAVLIVLILILAVVMCWLTQPIPCLNSQIIRHVLKF